MSVTRVEKKSNYTVVDNLYLRDKNISLKAKGLLSVILSLPDDWDYSVSGLAAVCSEKETSVKSALNELKKHGYLVVMKKMPGETKSGRIEYEYLFFEQPQKQENKKQDVEKQGIEILPLEKQEVEDKALEICSNKVLKENTEKQNLSSKSDDERDIQLSLSEDNNVIEEKPVERDTHVITLSVKEAAEEIYKPYPRKEGKAKGFEEIQAYLKKGRSLAGLGTVRFNHEQLYCAVRDYAIDCEEKGTERQYIQLFSTFMNKTAPDYVEKSAAGYEKYMEGKYGNDWRNIKFAYR